MAFRVTFPAMRFFWSMLVYALLALVLSWGILAMIHGNPWVLMVGLLAYVVLVAKFGCLPGKSH
jgi:hypothetical protein